MLKSSLRDCSDTYVLVKGNRTVPNTAAAVARANNRNKKIFKHCAPSEINNTEVDNTKDIDVVMYNLIEHSDNYQKTFEILWQYYRDEPTLKNDVIIDFPDGNMDSALFKLSKKQQVKQVLMEQKM